MQAAILAGGLGTRLRPLTEDTPKVMVPVAGKPVLLHLLMMLKAQGVDDVVLLTGHMGTQVMDYFGHGENLGIWIRYSQEKAGLLGTGGALKQAESHLLDNFFVINGDTYLPIDYSQVASAFIKTGRLAMMVVYDNSNDTGVPNNVRLG